VSEEKEKSKFLPWLLQTLNNNVDLPTNARVFIESVVEGKRDPITNEAFTEEELAIIRDLVTQSTQPYSHKQGEIGATPGYVNYHTYAKPLKSEGKIFGLPFNAGADTGLMSLVNAKGRVSTTLGQFAYKLNKDGDVEVVDNYNFNATTGGKKTVGTHYQEAGPIAKAFYGVASLGYLPLRSLGQDMMSSENEKGRPVKVVIPKEEFAEEDYARIVEQAKPAEMPKDYREGGRVRLI